MRINRFKKSENQGFTLIEVLVSLVIFAIGLLGLGLQMSNSLKLTINKNVHSSVLPLAQQAIEPLNKAIMQPATFRQALQNIHNNIQPNFSDTLIGGNQFTLSVAYAQDRVGNVLLSTDPTVTPWQPPYTVVLKVKYAPANTNTDLEFNSTHVFVPPPPPGP